MQLKPGKMAEAVEMTKELESELGQMGMKQFIIADKGDGSSFVLATYDSAEAQEAAGPKAAEILGRLAGLVAAPPVRKQIEIPINFVF